MSETLLLARREVERLLSPQACLDAVERAFHDLALGRVPAPGILGLHAGAGSFHVKAGSLSAGAPYFAAKINANFPGNARAGLPTIQGAVILFDATNGAPLAIMDSMAITALRTAAASALAAKHLARRDVESLLVCGCGAQAQAQLEALLCVRNTRRIHAYDVDFDRAQAFASRLASRLPLEVAAVSDLAQSARASDLIVTCTTATSFILAQDMVRPGTFVAAVGADSETKQEIDPRLLARAKVVTDLTEQASRIGDLHHAIAAGLMGAQAVHAELADVVAGRKPGREREDEIFVFDSTGTGLQDVAAAIAVYGLAREEKKGLSFHFSGETAA